MIINKINNLNMFKLNLLKNSNLNNLIIDASKLINCYNFFSSYSENNSNEIEIVFFLEQICIGSKILIISVVDNKKYLSVDNILEDRLTQKLFDYLNSEII